jgi:hypothetical protein
MTWGTVAYSEYYIIRWWDKKHSHEEFNNTEDFYKTTFFEELQMTNLHPDTPYTGYIQGINADTKSDPVFFDFHTKMRQMTPNLVKSSQISLEYDWPEVKGAIEYVLESIAQTTIEDPINSVIQTRSFRFDELSDGSQYLISMYATNDETTGVVKIFEDWTNLISPKVEITDFGDTYFQLKMEHVSKADGFEIDVNENKFTRQAFPDYSSSCGRPSVRVRLMQYLFLLF